MSSKWDLPPEPVPRWLNAALEVTHDDPKMAPAPFTARCVDALLALGCDVHQALGVCANTLNETGHGRYYRANNLGGWKITPGVGGGWWRAPGNKAPGATVGDLRGGDPPWCYYRAFASFEDYFKRWLLLFVPKPGTVGNGHRYRATGEAFWTQPRGGDWFLRLCKAGYKGTNTQRHPEGSVAEHEQLVQIAAKRWAQSRLPGLVLDGAWGPKSHAACEAFQREHGLAVTGLPDAATLEALANLTQPRA